MTAQMGVMRVTEEWTPSPRWASRVMCAWCCQGGGAGAGDAAAHPVGRRWRSFGGMVSANLQLDMSYEFFLNTLPRAVPMANLVIGLGKGVFGLLIALVACHFGLRVRPNTEPVGQHHGIGGHVDHRGDSGGCGFRHRHPQHRVAVPMSSATVSRRAGGCPPASATPGCIVDRPGRAGRRGGGAGGRLGQRQDDPAAPDGRAAAAGPKARCACLASRCQPAAATPSSPVAGASGCCSSRRVVLGAQRVCQRGLPTARGGHR